MTTRRRIRRTKPGQWTGEVTYTGGRIWHILGTATTHAEAIQCMDRILTHQRRAGA